MSTVTTPSTTQRDWPDIGYSAVIAETRSHTVSFTIHQIFGDYGGGSFCWGRTEDNVNVPEDDITKSDVYFSGFVKWDGCSNWTVNETKECMLHACNRGNILAWSEAMARCWDWASEILKDVWHR